MKFTTRKTKPAPEVTRANKNREAQKMTAYAIDYKVKDKTFYSVHVAAKDLKSAKKKLGKKHVYKDGRLIKVQKVCVCGYF